MSRTAQGVRHAGLLFVTLLVAAGVLLGITPAQAEAAIRPSTSTQLRTGQSRHDQHRGPSYGQVVSLGETGAVDSTGQHVLVADITFHGPAGRYIAYISELNIKRRTNRIIGGMSYDGIYAHEFTISPEQADCPVSGIPAYAPVYPGKRTFQVTVASVDEDGNQTAQYVTGRLRYRVPRS